jgi:hypothetical protein
MHAVRRIAVAVPLLLLVTVASAEEPKAPESKEAKPPVTTEAKTETPATTTRCGRSGNGSS